MPPFDPPTGRHTLAVLAADVAGYTSRMRADTPGTIAALDHIRETILRPQIEATHQGRLVKAEQGDNVLAIFPTSEAACRCAQDIQRGITTTPHPPTDPMLFRIGLSVGPVDIRPNKDIAGPAVIDAYRVQTEPAPGGIAMTRKLYDEIRSYPPVPPITDIGPKSFKPGEEPIHVCVIQPHAGQQPSPSTAPCPPPATPTELPPRLPNVTTNTAIHPASIARLSATLRASNDPEAAFYVYATPTFGTYRDEQDNIALEIGVTAAILTADSPSHEFVDHSELGTHDRPHNHITHEAAGWRITGELDANGLLRGHATRPDDGYLLAMRAKDTLPEKAAGPRREVALRLYATRADFIVRPTQNGVPSLPSDLKQKVLDAKVFEVLTRQRDNLRMVELASAVAKLHQE